MSKQPLIDQLDRAVTEILANPGAAPSSIDAALVDLVRVAQDLTAMPRPDFKMRLRSELQRRIAMSTKTVQFRTGFHTITPYVIMPEADAFISFMKQAFGAEETVRAESGPGVFHAEVRIGDSMLMIGGGPNYTGPRRLAEFNVVVPNSDEAYQRALAAGATSTFEMFESHGQRFGCINDAFGNSWIIAAEIGPERIIPRSHTVTPLVYTQDTPRFLDFIKRAFGAEELLVVPGQDGGTKHAWVKIGDSVLTTGDRQGQTKPAMLYLYVPDADFVYNQAIRAGAESIHPPTDQPYGDRNGGVTDAFGNQWYMATPL